MTGKLTDDDVIDIYLRARRFHVVMLLRYCIADALTAAAPPQGGAGRGRGAGARKKGGWQALALPLAGQ